MVLLHLIYQTPSATTVCRAGTTSMTAAFQTPMTQERLDDPAKREASLKEIPWHRAGQPEEIAKLALFLASPDADYVTGQTVVMDGGLTMNWGGA